MNKIVRYLTPVVLITFMMFADSAENSKYPSLGALLWAAIMIGSAVYILLRARAAGKSELLAGLGLIPYVQILAIMIFALLPDVKVSKKKAK